MDLMPNVPNYLANVGRLIPQDDSSSEHSSHFTDSDDNESLDDYPMDRQKDIVLSTKVIL